MIDDIREERKVFTQIPSIECSRIAEIHKENGFSLKATAKELGISVGEFLKLIYEHRNLQMAIAQWKKFYGYSAFGEKRGQYDPNRKDTFL